MGGFGLFEPPPPIKNLRGLLGIFRFLLMYFSISIIIDMATVKYTGSRRRPVCQIGKNQKGSKWHFKNITCISYIHFWKFHRFKPKEAAWLNPSNMNLGPLLVVSGITLILPRIHFTPPIQHLYLPTSPTHASGATMLPYAKCDSLIIIIVKHVSSK